MEITFYFKKTKTGYTSVCDLFEASIHKGIKGFGKTQEAAIHSLMKKWNNKTYESYKKLQETPGVNVKRAEISLSTK